MPDYFTKDDSFKQLRISGKGYACEAVGIISDYTDGGNTCYDSFIAEPSIGLPSGAKVTLNNHRDSVSSLSSSDGYSCECTVVLERVLKNCQ